MTKMKENKSINRWNKLKQYQAMLALYDTLSLYYSTAFLNKK